MFEWDEASIDFVRAWVHKKKYNLKRMTREDIIQQAYLKAIEYADNYNPKKGKKTTWLAQVIRSVVNREIQDLKHKGRDKELRFSDVRPNYVGPDYLDKEDKSCLIENILRKEEAITGKFLLSVAKSLLNKEELNILDLRISKGISLEALIKMGIPKSRVRIVLGKIQTKCKNLKYTLVQGA